MAPPSDDAPPPRPVGERVTEIGAYERIDRGRHPVAVAVGLVALIVVICVAMVGLGVAFRESDRRVDVADVQVPEVEGLTEDVARTELDGIGLITVVEEAPNEILAAGLVFEQSPIAGAKLEVGSPVTISVSTGPAGTIVPETIGQQQSEAQTLLASVGLTAEVVPTHDEVVRPGEVLGSAPVAGQRAPADRVVRLSVSDGPAPRTVPAAQGRTGLEVLADIGRVDLVPGEVTKKVGSGQPDGTALSTSPASGTRVPRGSAVDVVIAASAETTLMPAVMGLLGTTARDALEAVGVEARYRQIEVPAGDSRNGRVIRQGVPPGTELPGDLVVEILVAVAPPPPTTTTTAPAPTTPPATTAPP